MSDLRKAAEMALEFVDWLCGDDHSVKPKNNALKTREALRQALQPKLEWFPAPTKTEWGEMMVKTSIEIDANHYFDVYCEESQKHRVEQMLGVKREWVGLTHEEKHQLNDALNLQGRFPIMETIEAKLKEKNSGS